jgi:hypothetical protein
MHLELNEEECDALRKALDGAVKELSGEIADTDNAAYRKGLSTYRDTLRSISARLTG